jgi:hypothetical protein
VLTDSPTAPRSFWLCLPGNAITETDLRSGSLVAVEPTPAESPVLRLDLAGANPFRNAAELRYALPARGAVRLAIYDVGGRQVAVLAEGEQEAGPHPVRWGARGRSGVYLARLDFGGESRSQKIIRTH